MARKGRAKKGKVWERNADGTLSYFIDGELFAIIERSITGWYTVGIWHNDKYYPKFIMSDTLEDAKRGVQMVEFIRE